MKAGNISIDLELDGRQFSVQVRNASGLLRELKRDLQTTADATKGIQSHFDSFGTGLRHFMLTAASVRFALIDFRDVFLTLPTEVVKTVGEFQRLEKLLQGVSTAATDAGRALDATRSMGTILNLAKNSPFDIKALSDSFVKLKSAGIDPTSGALKTLSDSVAKFGGNSDTLHRASIAIQQMAGKGVISMEELRQQLGEAVPTAMRLMAEGMGMSMSELTTKVSKGTVEAKTAIAKMFAAMQVDSLGAAEKMMDTIPGALARLTTSFELFKNEVGKQGIGTSVQNQMAALTEFLESPQGVDLSRSIGQGLESVVTTLLMVKQGIVENWEAAKTLGEMLLLAFAGSKLKDATGTFEKWLDNSRDKLEKNKKALVDFRDAQAKDMEGVASKLYGSSANKAEEFKRQTQEIINLQQQAASKQIEVMEKLAAADKAQRLAPGWSQDKIARLRQESLEIQNETAKIHENIEALKARAAANQSGAASDKIMADAAAKKAKAIADGTVAISKSNSALQVYAAGLGNAAYMKERFSKAVSAAAAGLVGFGKSLVAMAGWAAVAYAAIEVVTWGFDKLFGAAKRAADEQERNLRIQRGQATEADLKSKKETLGENEKSIGVQERNLAFWTNQRGDKNKNQKVVEDNIAAAEAALAKLRKTNAELNEQIVKANKTVTDYEDQRAINALQGKLDRYVSDGMAGQGYYKRADDLRKQIETATGKGKEDLQKQLQDLYKESKLKQKELTEEGFRMLATDPAKNGVTPEQFESFKNDRYRQQFEALSADTALVTGENKYVAGKKTEKGPVDKLSKRAQEIADDLKIAKAKWNAVIQGTEDVDSLRAIATEEVMKMLDKGDLDTTLKGKTIKHPSADDPKVKQMIDDLTIKKVIEYGKRELPSLKDKASDLQNEINALDKSIATGDKDSYKNSKAESAIIKMIDKIIKDAPEAAEELKPIRDWALKIQELSQSVDAKNGVVSFLDSAKDKTKELLANTALMYATEDEARAARHQKELDDLAEQYRKIKELKGLSVEDGKKTDAAYDSWKSALLKKQEAESMTQLEKLRRQWEDTSSQMNNATKSWAEGFMDQLTSLITTGKADFRSMVSSWFAQLSRITLQNAIGGSVTNVFSGLGEWVKKNLFGNLASAASGASGVGDSLTKATSAVATSFAKTGISSETLTETMQTLSTNGVQATTASLIQQLGTANAKQIAEAAAISSLNSMALAAHNAASALYSIVSSSGSSSSSGLGGVLGAVVSGIAGAVGGGATTAPGFDAGDLGNGITLGAGQGVQYYAHANGGIMTEFGPLSLRKYANGGIANTPQAAIFGEGSTPEAYVPLPDGRSIPVTMSNDTSGSGAGVNQNVSIVITVNKDGSETGSTSGAGEDASSWRKMANRIKGVVREELITQQRPGGILYK